LDEFALLSEAVHLAAACRIGPHQIGVVGKVLNRNDAAGPDGIQPTILDRPDELNQMQAGSGGFAGHPGTGKIDPSGAGIDRLAVEQNPIQAWINPDLGKLSGGQAVQGPLLNLEEGEGAVMVPEPEAWLA